MTIITNSLTKTELTAYQEQMVTIYCSAFTPPPYNKGENEVIDFAQSLTHHIEREGFRIVIAGEDKTPKLLGFAYGYPSTPDQLFHQELIKRVSLQIIETWLSNSFRLVEMGVTPSAQGQGIGGLLHNHLLSGV